MSDDSQETEKKLIIDEDWKSQVEAEKKAARQAAESPPSTAAPASAEAGRHLPPADLSFLIGTLHLQAALALGMLVNPTTKKSEVRLDQAKHAIDLLTMLQEKTQGNRTPEESSDFESVLNELRWAYVSISQQPPL
jgi:hypothetical protein